jgi:hypothetical protein
MTTTLVVCPECSSPVAPGRLSCQSCGTLLASVVGADRRLAVAVAAAALPEIDEDRPLAAFRAPEPAQGPVRTAEPPTARRGPRRLTRSKPAAEPAKDRYVPDAEAAGRIPEPTSIFGSAPTGSPPIFDDWSNSPAGATTPSGTRGSSPDGGNMPGAYLAPSTSYVAPLAPRPAATPGPPSALPMAPAPFSPAAASWTAQQAFTSPDVGHGSNVAPRVGAVPTDDTGRSLSDWLVIGGATLAIVSFVLPWATDGVLGSNGIGYTAQWGLANGGHLILIVAAALVLLLHLGSSPVPGWFRSGVVPLAVGGVLAGLAFAYYARPYGGGGGVAVLLAGAVLLLAGGLLASRPRRNATGAPTV